MCILYFPFKSYGDGFRYLKTRDMSPVLVDGICIDYYLLERRRYALLQEFKTDGFI